MSFIYLSEGVKYDLYDGGPIRIEDIAVSLSRQCRYTGHGRFYFSVAQHCCNMVDLAERLGIADGYELLSLFLHDGAETYVGDVSAPLKGLLAELYDPIEYTQQAMVYEAFGVTEHPKYKEFDDHCAVAEKMLLFGVEDGKLYEMKYDRELLPDEAYKAFMGTYQHIRGKLC